MTSKPRMQLCSFRHKCSCLWWFCIVMLHQHWSIKNNYNIHAIPEVLTFPLKWVYDLYTQTCNPVVFVVCNCSLLSNNVSNKYSHTSQIILVKNKSTAVYSENQWHWINKWLFWEKTVMCYYGATGTRESLLYDDPRQC